MCAYINVIRICPLSELAQTALLVLRGGFHEETELGVDALVSSRHLRLLLCRSNGFL